MDCIIVPPFVCRAIREGENGIPTKHSVQPITKSSLKGNCQYEDVVIERDKEREKETETETETQRDRQIDRQGDRDRS